MKVYGVILAGGKGSRMGNTETPKQFLKLGLKPIIIHTIEKLRFNQEISEVIVVVPNIWLIYMKDLLKEYKLEGMDIYIIEGGEDRTESIINSLNFIEKTWKISEEDIILTHDAVRPFLSYRIVQQNIEAAKSYGAADTVIPATDTIVESKDNRFITCIPNRSEMFQGQTPQTFKISILKECYEKMLNSEKQILTDAAKLVLIKGYKVALVKGDEFNIKITKPADLIFANAILSQNRDDKNDK